MKRPYRDLIAVLALLTVSQLLSVLFSISNALTLTVGLAFSLYYLFDRDYLDKEEALTAAFGFLASTALFSAVKKFFVLNDLCAVAKASGAIEGSANVFSQGGVCKGVFQTWISTFAMDPFYNIFFWLVAVAGSVLAVLVYRKYGE
ncbi:hypothetical protein ACK3SF_00640 [Candidatus Nanosalina sp. VS9-1]|uniref:hypothetical protein n=1 Tax=Candidatus Nanosalina sp. VS9-1 TaxID=3388566 RepID=UPI0039DFD2A2